MAYAPHRSCNADLVEGMTDGRYKKIAMDQGGMINPTLYASRRDFNDIWYGFHEVELKMLGDGTMARTPNYRDNKEAQISV
jgi:hypothetical protein